MNFKLSCLAVVTPLRYVWSYCVVAPVCGVCPRVVQCVWNSYLIVFAEVLERIGIIQLWNRRPGVPEVEDLNAAAFAERSVSDVCHAVRNYQTRQAAVLKHPILDVRDAVRYCYTHKLSAIVERSISNACHTIWYCNVAIHTSYKCCAILSQQQPIDYFVIGIL